MNRPADPAFARARNVALRALVVNTFAKEWRNRGFLVLVALTLALLFGVGSLFDWLAPMFARGVPAGDLTTYKLKAFWWIIGLWSGLLGALLGVSVIRSDFEARMITQLLAFPISKFQYFAARLGGAWLLAVGYYAASILAAWLYYSFTTRSWVLEGRVFGGILLTALPLYVYLLFAVLASLRLARPLALVAVLVLGLLLNVSNAFFGSKTASDQFSEVGAVKAVGLVLHWGFPRVGVWNGLSNDAAFGKTPAPPAQAYVDPADAPPKKESPLWLEILHFTATASLWTWLAYALFRRTEYEL